MSNTFNNNLVSLRKANNFFAIFAACFSIFPFFFEHNIYKAGIYLISASIALTLGVYTNYKMQKEFENTRFIYVLTVIFYANVMLFGVYLGVWSNPGARATVFLCFLICALLMFIYPPLFNLCLTMGAMLVFIVSAMIIKNQDVWLFDFSNALIAGALSLYFTWHISKLRLGLEISANMLENDRDKYLDQSTIDELTQLRNRRDFTQTFQRYLSNYRTSDDWLCIAICDIDFFKNYNDHYGHPMGDDCLRGVGRILNSLKDSKGIYSARVGGEEFALLWFEKNVAHVGAIVTHIADLISDLKIPHEKSSVSPFVTLSIGIYLERCGASDDSKALYDLADKALYAAKDGGRNCAIISGNGIDQYKILPASNSAA